jgi:hypothetical protein
MVTTAVLADLVASKSIEERSSFQQRLGGVFDRLNERRGDSLLSPYTITLGDEFQALYRSPELLLSDVYRVIAALFPVRVRVAVSVGRLTTRVNPTAAIGMDGPVFVQARALLEGLKEEKRTIVQCVGVAPPGFATGGTSPEDIAQSAPPSLSLLDAALKLFSNALEGWKANTVAILAGLLENQSSEELAELLHISSRAVNKHIVSHHLRDHLRLFDAVGRELARAVHREQGN